MYMCGGSFAVLFEINFVFSYYEWVAFTSLCD